MGIFTVSVCCCVARAHTPTHTLNTYLRKLESWDQYGGMYVCMYVCLCSYSVGARVTDTHLQTPVTLCREQSIRGYVSK